MSGIDALKDDLQALLRELGLTTIETKVFLANLELGPGAASTIAQKAGVNRITAYEALKRLSKRGLIRIRAKKDGVRYFQTEDIEVIQGKLEGRKKELEQLLSKINFLKSDFRSLYTTAPDKPIVLFYEGPEAVRTVTMDTIHQRPAELLAFASADSAELEYNLEFYEGYWKRRAATRIPVRAIIPATAAALNFFTAERNRRELRQVRFVSKDVNLNGEIDIYGDNIAIISPMRNNEHGIIIRSASMAENLRSLFNFFWSGLK